MSTEVASTPPEEPLRTDGDRAISMKLATFLAVIAAVTGGGIWAYSIKADVQGIADRQTSLEAKAEVWSNILVDQRVALRLMDQKLDYLTNGSRGRPPAAGTAP